LLVNKEDKLDNRDTFAITFASLNVLIIEIGGDHCDRFIFANFV